jgi:hypothetical protein
MRGTASFWAWHQHAFFRDMVNFVYFNDVKSIVKFGCWLDQSLIMSFQKKPRHDSRSVCHSLLVIDKKKQEFSVPKKRSLEPACRSKGLHQHHLSNHNFTPTGGSSTTSSCVACAHATAHAPT